MNRRNRTLVVLLVAVAVASGASYFVYRAVNNIPVREVEVRSYYVAVASKGLPVGTMVGQSDVKLVAWPASSPVAGGYSQGRRGGEPRPDCAGRSRTSRSPPRSWRRSKPAPACRRRLPTGMRAISVKVNEVIGVAGFVVPGTRVDVVVTIGKQDDSVSRVIVSNAQVLTAGTKYDQEQAKDGKPVRARWSRCS